MIENIQGLYIRHIIITVQIDNPSVQLCYVPLQLIRPHPLNEASVHVSSPFVLTFLATIYKLSSVHSFSGYKQLSFLSVLVRVSEGYESQGGPPTWVVDYLTDYTLMGGRERERTLTMLEFNVNFF